jgi:hypothetical protein
VRAVLRFWSALALLPLIGSAGQAAGTQSGAAISAELHRLSVDPARTYRVRDLELVKGDIKLYLTEGVLTFGTPIAGRLAAALFTTAQSEGGDAELLLMPPRRSERASLAAFAKSPNLDEHFSSAVFYFSDDTASDLLSQIQKSPSRATPVLDPDVMKGANGVLRTDGPAIDVRMVEAMLDNHAPAQGFFFGMIGGRDLGTIDVMYEPEQFEPVSVGKIVSTADGREPFQIWTSFRPARAPAFVLPPALIRDYKLDTVIHPDLSMSATARFEYAANARGGRVIALDLAARLRVTGASIDGRPAEIFQHETLGGGVRNGGPDMGIEDTRAELFEGVRDTGLKGARTFLLISDSTLAPGTEHQVEVRYEGSVIRQTGSGSYFVDERNAWYPFTSPMLSSFDLTFHCPENLRLVSTGELVSEDVAGGVRNVHRKTQSPEPLAGFNLGNYTVASEDHGRYHIEFYADKSSALGSLPAIPAQTASVLDYYSARWMPLPTRSLAISPIEGYFGQGFPGLIYLSNISYLREEDRPASLRNPRLNSFFSEVLLPHELAHQWWGNIVKNADYRTAWLMEAMANYSAFEFLERSKGAAAIDDSLAAYREDLSAVKDGKSIESAGPVDFGDRLLENSGLATWHLILYEKGTWILHMLRRRLGDSAFRELQKRMLEQYAAKPISNEDFRRLAAQAMPAGQPDKSLSLFFDTWVYGTGIPAMKLRQASGGLTLTLSGVEDDFTTDVPLTCKSHAGSEQIHWVRASSGVNTLDLPNGSHTCALPSPADFLFFPD